jgi:dTDP-4-dehydrorhamnose 3,5-epimerase
MLVKDTQLVGVKLIESIPVFEDFRGRYKETFNKAEYKKIIDIEFVQDDISVSRRNVLRGIHGDKGTWKLISCLKGAFYLVVVNNDEKSAQYKFWESFTLSDSNNLQVLIPPKFGNGHLVLTDETIFHYKQSTYYGEFKQFTILWNDPEINIAWPSLCGNNPILSLRDS